MQLEDRTLIVRTLANLYRCVKTYPCQNPARLSNSTASFKRAYIHTLILKEIKLTFEVTCLYYILVKHLQLAFGLCALFHGYLSPTPTQIFITFAAFIRPISRCRMRPKMFCEAVFNFSQLLRHRFHRPVLLLVESGRSHVVSDFVFRWELSSAFVTLEILLFIMRRLFVLQ